MAPDLVKTEETTIQDRPFNPFYDPRSDNVKIIIKDVLRQLQNYEAHLKLRARKRRLEDQKNFEAAVKAVVCDLIHRYTTQPDGWISISLSREALTRANRYKPPFINKTLPTVLERLASPELGFMVMNKGFQGYFNNGRQTTIQAGPRLVRRIDDLEIDFTDLKLSKQRETIVLKRKKTGPFDSGSRYVKYEDDDLTRRYRDEMTRINEWLSQADISFNQTYSTEDIVDDTNRFMRRVFNNGSFEQGGRLFGGFWQELTKWQRVQGIRINKSPIVMLDYGQMAARILYGIAGVQPPKTDLYTIPTIYPDGKPNLVAIQLSGSKCRVGIKKIFNVLLHVEKMPERFPSGTRQYIRKLSIQTIVKTIMEYHHAVSHLFFTPKLGMRIMFTESEILVDVLLSFIENKIVGLPIHDGLVVAEGDKDRAIEIMLSCFKENTGIDGEVSIEDDYDIPDFNEK